MVSLIKGLSIVGIGVFTLAWMIVKIVSCIFISGYISNYVGFTGLYWWFSSIILFCILGRLCISGNVSEDYGKLIDTTFNEEPSRTDVDVGENPIFEVLRDYYKKYDCKIIFSDETELVISKDNVCSYHDNFIFLHEDNEFRPVFKCFNIDTIDTIIRLD